MENQCLPKYQIKRMTIPIKYLGQENGVYIPTSFESFENFCPLNMAASH